MQSPPLTPNARAICGFALFHAFVAVAYTVSCASPRPSGTATLFMGFFGCLNLCLSLCGVFILLVCRACGTELPGVVTAWFAGCFIFLAWFVILMVAFIAPA